MSALQVEWITFKKARKVIISEISRQLNTYEDCDYEQVLALSSAEEGIWKWVCDRLCYCTCQLVPKGYRYDMINNAETMKLLILPPLVSVICLVIACSISSFNFETILPRIIAIVVIFIIMMLNVAIVLRYKKGARYEIKDQLRDILEHYISSIETHSTKSRVGSFLSGEKTNGDDNLARHGLISGHSHVSIVSVYRENQWQRLPSLLLTKGDIISLMAGDKTPGRVFELVVDSQSTSHTLKRPPTSVSGTSAHPNRSWSSSKKVLAGWKLGRQIGRGDKILLRDERKRYSAPTMRKHEPSPTHVPDKNLSGGCDDENAPSVDITKGSFNVSSSTARKGMANPAHDGDTRPKHARSINSESIELLTLHSDMRCFVMDETPIAVFCESLLQSLNDDKRKTSDLTDIDEEKSTRNHAYIPHQPGSKDIEMGISYLHQQFLFVHQKSVIYSMIWAVTVLLISAVRIVVVNYHDSQENNTTSTLDLSLIIPFANIIIAFMPISLPVSLIMVEALTTASILATSEALICHGLGEDESNDKLNKSEDGSMKSTSHSHKRKTGFLRRKYMNIGVGAKLGNSDDDSSSDGNDDCVDEYQDEDIDDRVGKVAKYARYNVSFSRQWQYFCRVINVRLKRPNFIRNSDETVALSYAEKNEVDLNSKGYKSLSSLQSNELNDGCDPVVASQPFLPVPLVRTKLIETLGAVTMVCFIDDDLVCESFSMTEEVYLLRNQIQDNARHNVGSVDASSPVTIERKLSNIDSQGVVLDLHANTEASGSRFESPKWFLNLPSLKPLGMNAMLAYMRSSTLSRLTPSNLSVLHEANATLKPRKKSNVENVSSEASRRYPYTYAHPPSNKDKYPSIPSFTSPAVDRADSDSLIGKEPNSGNATYHIPISQRTIIEKTLIKHTKQQDPLECLRELSEEIGFEEIDVTHMKSIADVSVLAPGLEDFRLMEDTHAWSQEQTRKRGIFESHINGSVFEDCIKGSVQLMTHGSPPLLMSYCREYWDGSNISPLTNTDRKELMGIFERWDLEDFDVVAFGYAPVPVAIKNVLQPLVKTYSEDVKAVSPAVSLSRKQSSTRSYTSNVSDKVDASIISSLLPPTSVKNLIYVDPCSAEELKATGSRLQKSKDPVQSDTLNSKAYKGQEGVKKRNSDSNIDKTATSSIMEEVLSTKKFPTKVSKSKNDGQPKCEEEFKIIGADPTALSLDVDTSLNVHRSLVQSNEIQAQCVGGGPASTTDTRRNLSEMHGINVGTEESPRSSVDVEGVGSIIRMDSPSRRSGESTPFSLLIDEDFASTEDSVSQKNTPLYPSVGRKTTTLTSSVKKSVSLDNVAVLLNSDAQSLSPSESSHVSQHQFCTDLKTDLKEERKDIESNDTFNASFDLSPKNSMKSVDDVYDIQRTSTLPRKSHSGGSIGHKKILSNPNPTTTSSASLGLAKSRSPKAHDSSLIRNLSEVMWPVVRQQVFLGMAASSVPVRPVINDIYEDLSQAGVRFVYFSPRNMRRSKKVAEKIGLETDWNCAISLRALAADTEADPHRYISDYADWDVKAKLPHGIKAIKQHLREVDNVPLLVSLFTDSTPSTIVDMVDIFRDHGEVVMSLGSSYRSHNQAIYAHSDVAVSIDMLPSELSHLSSSGTGAITRYPVYHDSSICQTDLAFLFRLVGLQTSAILQAPCPLPTEGLTCESLRGTNLGRGGSTRQNNVEILEKCPETQLANQGKSAKFSPSLDLLGAIGAIEPTRNANQVRKEKDHNLNLSSIMEAIRAGRIFILNGQQALAFLCITLTVIGLCPIYSQAIPLSVPPMLSPPMLLLFIIFYIPGLPTTLAVVNAFIMSFNTVAISMALLFSPAPTHLSSEHNIMKNTPRKNAFIVKKRDEDRFWWYFFHRVAFSCFAVFVVGWMASASPLLDDEKNAIDLDVDYRFTKGYSWTDRMTTFRNAHVTSYRGMAHYNQVQDIISCQLLLSLISHSLTLLHRGQSFSHLPINVTKYPVYFLCLSTCLFVHATVLLVRMHFRPGGAARYVTADYYMWIALCAFPCLEVGVAIWVNSLDYQNYKRHLQFLRLEFDTRLGMYSPR